MSMALLLLKTGDFRKNDFALTQSLQELLANVGNTLNGHFDFRRTRFARD